MDSFNLNIRAQNMGKTSPIKKESVRFDRETAIERACYCPSYSPSKIRIQEYFVCDPPSPPLDICEDCPINGLREPSTIVIATYNKNDEVEDIEEDLEEEDV